jgi:hypothetical protein
LPDLRLSILRNLGKAEFRCKSLFFANRMDARVKPGHDDRVFG